MDRRTGTGSGARRRRAAAAVVAVVLLFGAGAPRSAQSPQTGAGAAAAGTEDAGAADARTMAAGAEAAGAEASAAGEATVAPTVYGPGERMVFDITYGPISAGEGTLETVGVTEHNGRRCYHIQSTANSNRFFSSVYKVRDKIISYIDTETLYSLYFYKRLREGDYKKTVEIEFDHAAELARYHDGRTFPISHGVQDVLSAFYYVRNLDLAVGADFTVPAHSSRRTYDLRVIVHGRERVDVQAGSFDCFVVEPVIEGEGLFKHEGRITLFITDDAHRLPVLIKTKVPVGSIDVELKEFRLGKPLVPRVTAGGRSDG